MAARVCALCRDGEATSQLLHSDPKSIQCKACTCSLRELLTLKKKKGKEKKENSLER